jgi:hypothetical protein
MPSQRARFLLPSESSDLGVVQGCRWQWPGGGGLRVERWWSAYSSGRVRSGVEKRRRNELNESRMVQGKESVSIWVKEG